MNEGPLSEESGSILAASPVFRELAPELLAGIRARAREHAYKPGDLLIRQGDPGDALFVILEGKAVAVAHEEGGAAHTLGWFQRGSVVGEMALVTREPRSADVVADSAIRALVLPADDFHQLAERHPELAVLLTNVVADRLGESSRDGLGGKVIHGYRITRAVGRGGMAVVYEARRLEDQATVALKMMSHRLLYQAGAVSRFRTEAEIVKTLRHENIAALYDEFPAYRTRFLAMEFCDGRTLHQIVQQRGPLDEATARKILGQLACALRYVHARGVVHRDLKPSNVMLNLDGRVKLMDFGLALPDPLSDHTVTRSQVSVGTPIYMAPEQLSRAEAGVESDLYALACIVYEIVSGSPLFTAADFMTLVEQKLAPSVPPASQIGRGISDELHELIHLGLKRERGERRVSLDRMAEWADRVPLS